MNNRLEQFVRDHREEFDSEEPDMKIWDKIQLDLDPPAQEIKGSAPLFPINRTWMSAAAAVILLLAGSLWFFTGRHGNPDPQTQGQTARQVSGQKTETPSTANGSDTGASTTPEKQQPSLAATDPARGVEQGTRKNELASTGPNSVVKKEKPAASSEESNLDEEMYHYARLVEIKHQQLKTIEKDEPMLYKQFSSDVNKLDSVYHGLQRELPSNPNREQLLEAMLQNLQLQMQLLSHQLEIVKQINHSKQKAYEKAYKTI